MSEWKSKANADDAQRRRTLGFLTSEPPLLRSPDPHPQLHEQYGWCDALLQDSVTLVCSFFFLFFFFDSFLLRNERHFRKIHSCWSSTVEREIPCSWKNNIKKRLCLSPPLLEPDWTDGSQWAKQTLWKGAHRNKTVNGSSLEDVQQNSSIPIFSTLLKKENCTMKRKRKILKKVCEMSKYLTLIPLLREMCFPYYHSCLEKKNDYDSGKLKFLCIFLLVTEQMWFGFWTWNHLFFFSKGEQSLSFWFHLSSSIYFLSFFSLYGRFYVPIPCGESRLCTSIMFSKFVFYLFLSIWPETRRQPLRYDGLRRFTLLPCSSGFSLSPFQAYSSQYLPVLSKCYCKVFQWDDSKYVYINRGNTLGYILLTPCVAWCLSCLLVYDVCRWLEKPALDLTWKTSINQLKNKSFLLIITAELAR